MFRALPLLAVLATACVSPASADPPPIGAPRTCPHDDGSGVPLARSSTRSTLPESTARAELESENDLCPDTACEGSFEWYYYDLRSADRRSELTMRVYTWAPPGGIGDASHVTVRGEGFQGRVLGQHRARQCRSPCGGETYRGCLTLDLRCTIDRPYQRDMTWSRPAIACGIALERAIRERIPEYFPDEE